jgi:hypothetical protein
MEATIMASSSHRIAQKQRKAQPNLPVNESQGSKLLLSKQYYSSGALNLQETSASRTPSPTPRNLSPLSTRPPVPVPRSPKPQEASVQQPLQSTVSTGLQASSSNEQEDYVVEYEDYLEPMARANEFKSTTETSVPVVQAKEKAKAKSKPNVIASFFRSVFPGDKSKKASKLNKSGSQSVGDLSAPESNVSDPTNFKHVLHLGPEVNKLDGLDLFNKLNGIPQGDPLYSTVLPLAQRKQLATQMSPTTESQPIYDEAQQVVQSNLPTFVEPPIYDEAQPVVQSNLPTFVEPALYDDVRQTPTQAPKELKKSPPLKLKKPTRQLKQTNEPTKQEEAPALSPRVVATKTEAPIPRLRVTRAVATAPNPNLQVQQTNEPAQQEEPLLYADLQTDNIPGSPKYFEPGLYDAIGKA